MRKYTIAWSGFAILSILTQVTAASEGATVLWDNVVCMSLPMFVLCLLLPAEDIVTYIAQKIGVKTDSKN